MPFFRPFATFAHLASLVASCLVHPPSRIAGALFRSLHQCMHAHTYYRRSLSIRLRYLRALVCLGPSALKSFACRTEFCSHTLPALLERTPYIIHVSIALMISSLAYITLTTCTTIHEYGNENGHGHPES
ncbi:hypothetical protein J3A83DRAFT_4215667 [Scleroderma citrinum]